MRLKFETNFKQVHHIIRVTTNFNINSNIKIHNNKQCCKYVIINYIQYHLAKIPL